ncbi:adenylate/guanylate cyclase domain-containing protein [Aequorivita antarctica]|uniref:Adenylate cyclase n=1 Tax=Aequorivita antarctica TaxID=153266 RepID=A0A5C6Z4P6_9FLAO|nr:adenylate/guanylate cyclase domain-containing protein [Aequorivita antarctica]TXD74456.1 adenylate/guanylate cyclase domain-containing protein [Aequorivita antarctica]SRX73815.1 Adenylate cyclase [Aequorivita antarctica]
MIVNRKAYFLIIGFFCLFNSTIIAQDQRIADSLAGIYRADTLKGNEKLELLRELSFNEVKDNQRSLQYAEELIQLSEKMGDYPYLSQGYYQKGSAHRLLGNLEEAVKAFFKSAEFARKINKFSLEGSAYGAIASVYSITDNHKNAMLYYNKAIATLRKDKDKVALASTILNAGDALLTKKKYDSALVYFKESGEIFEQLNYATGKAYNLGNIGMVYANTGKKELAEKNINEAIHILQESEDYYPISVYLMAMSDIYLEKGQWQAAIDYSKRSLTLAKQYGLKEQIGDANKKIAELYEQAGDSVLSYKYYKSYIIYRDSVVNVKNVQQMGDLRTNYEVSQKQIEVDLLDQKRKNQRNIIIATAIALFLIILMAIGLYRRNNFIRKTKKIIEQERDRSDSLLLNILPEETAAELKQNGAVKAKKYDSVTVLFTDFKGFTNYSEKLSPEALVETVSFYFSRFDEIVEKHGLEKIKTIGDAYMCAGGLHSNTEDHAKRMILAAIEIAAFVEKTKKDVSASELTFDIRIGINTGPVVAGVVGTKKFAYDIWGDTVNVASRMETMSEPGKINIGENTYELVKDTFECEYRGEIAVKNRGAMKMYFINNN